MLGGDAKAATLLGEYLQCHLSEAASATLAETVALARSHGASPRSLLSGEHAGLVREIPGAELFEWEATLLFDGLPPGDEAAQKWAALIPVIVAGMVCAVEVALCYRQVAQAANDCYQSLTCQQGETSIGSCCQAREKDDYTQCLFSCGSMGPDGDYASCCRAPTGFPPGWP